MLSINTPIGSIQVVNCCRADRTTSGYWKSMASQRVVLLLAIIFHRTVARYSQRPFKAFTLPILIVVLTVINMAAIMTFVGSYR